MDVRTKALKALNEIDDLLEYRYLNYTRDELREKILSILENAFNEPSLQTISDIVQ